MVLVSRYRTLTLPEDEAADCLFVNGTLLHANSVEAPLSAQVRKDGRREIFSLFQCSGFQRKNKLPSEGNRFVRIL